MKGVFSKPGPLCVAREAHLRRKREMMRRRKSTAEAQAEIQECRTALLGRKTTKPRKFSASRRLSSCRFRRDSGSHVRSIGSMTSPMHRTIGETHESPENRSSLSVHWSELNRRRSLATYPDQEQSSSALFFPIYFRSLY